ncbi:AAA family ATPase [Roseburia hominis]|uniref:AAA family ATPase n=1 Tax=Roseburia hominis TaxID=301301 RepID=UPI001F367236|nr:AAA family ATPase [Roseburia hominis]
MGTQNGSRTVAIGIQDFAKIREMNYFYVDKTDFIRQWWSSGDDVTLIARPRRFGKTLNISMLEHFFSNQYAGQGELFEGLSIWEDEEYRKLQGTYPVISLSFANVKENTFQKTIERIYQILTDLYNKHIFLLDSGLLTEEEKRYFLSVNSRMDETTATIAIHHLADFMYRYYGKKVIILLDEYDTPMQEAYVNGFWDELVAFTRSLFNSTFKTNPYLERAMMTGITRVSKESIFSDLNNLEVVTTTSEKYATAFGFTEEEVFAAMDEMGLTEKKEVKRWYDGFVFGSVSDIYNPWSIINYLDKGRFGTYWANTSANGLVGKLIREGSSKVKETFESLLAGETITTTLDEQIVYNQLGQKENAIWSLLLASGYLKVIKVDVKEERYELGLTNYEVKRMFQNMVSGWFDVSEGSYNDFIKALLLGDLDAMNEYMNRVSLSVFSSFDTGKRPSGAEPERFYHGFVLGLMVDLRNRYVITSNRESGFGRYDVMLEPKDKADDAFILEFKVFNRRREQTLEDTVAAALAQIEEKNYAAALMEKGIPATKMRKYGLAFEGKNVLIG